MARSTRSRKSVKATETPVEVPVVETHIAATETPVVETPTVETPAVETPEVPPQPALHLLPLYLGRMAEHSDLRDSSSRFALSGVLVEFKPDNTFVAVTTDTKHLVHIEGQCQADPAEFPDSLIPALATAPNGATKAIIPSRVWRESFKKAKTLTRRTRQTALKSLAVVVGENSSTLAATDSELTQCDTTPHVQGKYAPYEDIIRKARKDGTTELRVAVDAKMLAGLLTTIADYNDEDSCRAELVFRFNVPEPVEVETPAEGEAPEGPKPILIEKPFLVEAQNHGSKFTGLIMPLAG